MPHAFASTWEVEVNYKTGQADTIDETEEIDLDYSFNKTGLRLKTELSPLLNYSLKLDYGTKSYSDDESLDNSNIGIKNSFSHVEENKNEKNTRRFNINYQNKAYENTPNSSYSKAEIEIETSNKQKDSHKFYGSGGFNWINYSDTSKEAEQIVDAKLGFEKYYYEKTLIFDGYAKIETSTQAKYDKELTYKLGVKYNQIKSSIKSGFRNSLDDEEFEDSDLSHDYHYVEFTLSNKHPLAELLEAKTFYQTITKTYISGSYDSTGFTAGLDLKYKTFKNFYIKVGYTYREKYYESVESLSHVKNLYSASANYRIRSNWGIKAELNNAIYSFEKSPEKDRTDTSLAISIDKYLGKTFKLFFEARQRFKDYTDSDDNNLSTFKVGVNSRW